MTDPLDALRTPITPVDPDPIFAARLRERLRALLEPPEVSGGRVVTQAETTQAEEAESAWPPALTPYITVSDGRRALDWYVTVFGARRRGQMYVMPDGSIGHAELAIGDAVLMLSEGSTQVPVQPPTGSIYSHSLHLQVDDVDSTVRLAREQGAAVEREPGDQPYGRVAVIIDPFNHRWMLNTPPPGATRIRPGDVGYVTIAVPDDQRARDFYGAVLGWRFQPGTVPGGWQVSDTQPPIGLSGGSGSSEVQLCYRVTDIEAATRRVREHGGQVAEIERKPYGLLVECVDDQGMTFQLWQPPGA
jgi:uncharacterized glyoxalase superfamily protein PhnB